DAHRAEPGELTESIDGCDAEDVDADALAEQEALVVPAIGAATAGAFDARGLERKLEQSDVGAARGDGDLIGVQKVAGRAGKFVEAFADSGVGNVESSWLVGERAAPDELAVAERGVVAGLTAHRDREIGKRNHSGRQGKGNFAVALAVDRLSGFDSALEGSFV